LRKLLVDDNYLWAVISLPQGVFNPYAGVKTSVLLLDKNIAKKTDNILFVNVENDGFDLGAQRKEIDKNDLPEILNSLRKYKELILNDKEVKESELFNTNVVGKSRIKDSGDYNLSGKRYQSSQKEVSVKGKWERILLKEVADLQNGYAFKSSDYVDNSNTVNFRMSNIRPNASVDIEYNIKYLPDEYYERYKSFALKDGDLVIAMTDMAGDPKILGVPTIVETKGKKVLMNQRVGKFTRIDENRIMIKYLKYILQSGLVKMYYKSLGSGGLQINISKDQVLSLEIPLPPLEEQKKIVEELDRYQRIIDGARMVIDNWKPEIEINPDWELIKLKEVCELVRGVTYSKDDEVEVGGKIVLRANNIDLGGALNLDDLKFINKELKETQKLKKGDIFICMASGSKSHIGKVAFIDKDTDYYFGGFMGCIRAFDNINPKYLYYTLNSPAFNKYLRGQISGVNINNINQTVFYNFKIPLPSMNEQKDIVEEISKLENSVLKNKEIIDFFELKSKDVISKIFNE
nr:restriction endonuclease subunit S [Patescibacteria group bacterium]